jgi:hypothetical protein
MINIVLQALKMAKGNESEFISIAKGYNKLPENWSEFKRALKHIKQRNGN